MNRRHDLIAVFVLGLFGVPLLLPLLELRSPGSWAAWAEADRIAELIGTTLGLCALVLVLAGPAGIALAVLLYRTDLPCRVVLRSALAVGLFVPLPLFALAWQAVGGGGWRPWTHGVLWAALVHAAAALPWVVWLTGLGLRRVEPELEEDALTAMPAARVLWHVSLRRASPAIGLAAVWVVLQAAGEITVTDLGVVRTFAEEVYTQFVTAGSDALGRAVAVSIPATLLTVLAVAALTRRWEGRLTVLATPRPALVFRLGRARWPAAAGVLVTLAAYAGIPLVSLLRQAGGGEAFTVTRLGLELKRAVHLQIGMVLDSLAWSAAAGVLAAGLALLASWAAADSRGFRGLLFVLAVALWAVPGPVLGFGLKATIERLMDLEDVLLAWTTVRPLKAGLYELSTPVPVLWAHVARLFPYAVAFIWPAVRDVPRDLREAARVDGAGPWGEFRRVIWPAARGAVWLAAVAVTALALGELGASKLVQVPGRQTFAQELFNQMHYAATATTAALALVQLALALLVVGLFRLVARDILSSDTHPTRRRL
ncbi:MAG TPA: ABC transporter permease subunit [Gemmataceae bacterium]|nr:ABC transporter permease subunit [Gemmataceae bacterium]